VLRLIDTHAHLDEVENVHPQLEQAKKIGVIAIVAVGSNYQSNTKILEIAQRYPRFVYPAIGLHPWDLGGFSATEVRQNLQFIEENLISAVALGEVGLDYDKRVVSRVSKELQREVLTQLLEIAKRCSKPVVIHSRYAWKDALHMIQNAGINKAVFHWFTGFSSVLETIIDYGYFVSATPAGEYHEEHRRAIKEAPLDRLLLETDCPVMYGRENRYQSQLVDVLRSLKVVSQIKALSEAVVAHQTTVNAVKFFNLDLAL